MMKISTRILLAATILLTGCSGVDVSTYADNRPRFDIFSYFSGDTRGWGMVQDRSGEMTRQFVVDIVGEIDQTGQLVLTEDFIWNDGERSRRIWTIAKTGPHTYSGTADDVIGVAHGSTAGNALNWTYDLSLKVDNSTWKIRFDDWMFLQEDDVLLNKAKMTKFGVRVGEVTIAFKKPETNTGG
jgi:hypothetical protein